MSIIWLKVFLLNQNSIWKFKISAVAGISIWIMDRPKKRNCLCIHTFIEPFGGYLDDFPVIRWYIFIHQTLIENSRNPQMDSTQNHFTSRNVSHLPRIRVKTRSSSNRIGWLILNSIDSVYIPIHWIWKTMETLPHFSF